MSDYQHILFGLPVMYLVVIIAMIVVIAAMCMDAVFGWRKAKERIGDYIARMLLGNDSHF